MRQCVLTSLLAVLGAWGAVNLAASDLDREAAALEQRWSTWEQEVAGGVRALAREEEERWDRVKQAVERRAVAGMMLLQRELREEEAELTTWLDETLEAVESTGGRVVVDVETGVLQLARDVESDVDREYGRLRRELTALTEEARETAERIAHEVEHAAVDVAAEGLSDARAILRDLSRQSPAPVEAPTVPPIDSALSDVALPMQTQTFPQRPPPALELGNRFFAPGYIGPGFRLPTGTMIQPQFFLFGLFRTGVQTFDNGEDPRFTQWVNSLQLFANFNATPTERLLVEFRPLDDTVNFSGYNWEPTSGPDSGWQNALNGRLYQLFFEGDFLNLFPALDNGRSNLLGFDFSVGRQQVFLQSGVLINDFIDMVSITHPSLFTFGSSAASASFIYAWGNIHRSKGYLSPTAQLIGGTFRGDFMKSTVSLDAFFGPANRAAGGNGFYVSSSSIQRIGRINTAFTAAASVALDPYQPEETGLDTGGLLFAQLSTDVPGTENILYFNAFWAIETFTSASRQASVGGPLAQAGLLFAASGLGDFGAALGSTASNAAGGSLGYQMLFGDLYRRQLIFEVGAKTQTIGEWQQSVAGGVQYQQAFGQRWTWTVGAVGALQRENGPLYGLRMELDFSF